MLKKPYGVILNEVRDLLFVENKQIPQPDKNRRASQ